MDNFSDQWRHFQRALSVHMQLEDDGLFPLLDSVGNSAVTEAKLGDEHNLDQQLQAAVDRALSKGDKAAIRQTFEAWSGGHLAHLTHEEDVMMPIIPKTGKNCIEHGQVVHERLFSAIKSMDEFDWALGWIVDKLNGASGTSQPADVMVRVFVWGLHYSADDSQWRRWLPIIKTNVSPDLYQQMVDNFHIDRPGRIGAITDTDNEFSYLPADGPKPVPFAVMRNTHEALRLGISELSRLLEVE